MDLRIDQGPREGASCVFELAGEVDVYTAPQLKRHLIDAVEEGCLDIIIDLSEVDFIDSTGLGVLVGALKRARERDGSLRIAGARESIVRILRITGLDRVFQLFATVEEARESVD